MAFFRNFPRLNYKFGDEITTSLFQNISVYIDLIDQIANDGSFYQTYTVLDGDRPDVVSQKLYGTPDYYWTFYLLNENIRVQGWPLTVQEVFENSRIYYPNIVITTEADISNTFKVGGTAIQGSVTNPTAKGEIIERNLNLGQLVVRPIIEVRSIEVTNGGLGYINIPEVTVTGGGGTGASATATITNGSVTSVNILSGGSGFASAPTITIAPPRVIDYNNVASKIVSIVNGVIISGPYFDFLTASVSGFARGDVDNSGGLTLTDANLITQYALNVSNVTADVNNKITTILRPAILANAATLPDFVPGGAPGGTATATATLSSNSFRINTNIVTVVGEPNNLNWNVLDLTPAFVRGVVDQYDSIHHYEDTDGEWVDINPYDQTVSTSGKIPVTVFERLQLENDNLKTIKVLKPSVAAQVYSEFQKVLTRR
jgi:hypothetical protein